MNSSYKENISLLANNLHHIIDAKIKIENPLYYNTKENLAKSTREFKSYHGKIFKITKINKCKQNNLKLLKIEFSKDDCLLNKLFSLKNTIKKRKIAIIQFLLIIIKV